METIHLNAFFKWEHALLRWEISCAIGFKTRFLVWWKPNKSFRDCAFDRVTLKRFCNSWRGTLARNRYNYNYLHISPFAALKYTEYTICCFLYLQIDSAFYNYLLPTNIDKCCIWQILWPGNIYFASRKFCFLEIPCLRLTIIRLLTYCVECLPFKFTSVSISIVSWCLDWTVSTSWWHKFA